MGDSIELQFDRNVRVHDGRPFRGFAIAGEDRHFFPAEATFVVVGKSDRGQDKKDESRLKVSHPLVKKPVAVRYAWARNPIGNAVNSRHHERTIPIVSFRTDDWDWPDCPFGDANEHRQMVNKMRAAARGQAKARLIDEARLLLKTETGGE